MSALSITQLEGCGAQIAGVRLAQLSDGEMDAIRQAYFDHGVIFFRDQTLTPEEHIAFARRWGAIDINRFFTPTPDHPQIAEVRKEKEQKTNIGGGWHTDHSYDEIPAMGSILVARTLPQTGGDTLFAGMYAAYDTLSDDKKALLEGLRAVHSNAHVFGAGGTYANADNAGAFANPEGVGEAIHPVVIAHPQSGKKALYVNPGFTIRFEFHSREESQPLLQELFAHAMQKRFVHRFQWRPGSVAFWDNRATWHFALNDYHGQQRLMHRITVAGSPLAGVA
ncbi:MAG TPA: TauD/TfdA family dioxygenase [Rhizomicrobium sp.]|jgi:taurine dioxygenase